MYQNNVEQWLSVIALHQFKYLEALQNFIGSWFLMAVCAQGRMVAGMEVVKVGVSSSSCFFILVPWWKEKWYSILVYINAWWHSGEGLPLPLCSLCLVCKTPGTEGISVSGLSMIHNINKHNLLYNIKSKQ